MTFFFIWCLLVGMAFAESRSPSEYPLSTYGWVLGLALWGGAVAHIRKYTDGRRPKTPLATAFVDITGSGLAGLLVFLGCEYANLDRLLAAVIIGISGHMGARALFLLEKVVLKRYPQLNSVTKPGDLDG